MLRGQAGGPSCGREELRCEQGDIAVDVEGEGRAGGSSCVSVE